ncbi:MAG: Uma2 family endonuclease [Candidatus Lokiarchaeota archaeon]|nr:Uma2 family endonuclease [Candidatus Lokiarchaeota archaeon]
MTLTLRYQDGKEIEGPFIVLKQNATEEEFLAFSNEDVDCELLDGVLVIHSPANDEHEDMFSYLMTIFRTFLDATRQGKVRGSRYVMRLSDRWSPEPDLLVVTPERFKAIGPSHLDGPADLVIEILSDATRDIDLTKKLPKYLAEGVREVWIIDPKDSSVHLHFPDTTIHYPEPTSDEIIRSRVLPDLQIKLEWIWHREQHPTSTVLRELLGF